MQQNDSLVVIRTTETAVDARQWAPPVSRGRWLQPRWAPAPRCWNRGGGSGLGRLTEADVVAGLDVAVYVQPAHGESALPAAVVVVHCAGRSKFTVAVSARETATWKTVGEVDGSASGVAVADAADAAPVPIALAATTVKVYTAPVRHPGLYFSTDRPRMHKNIQAGMLAWGLGSGSGSGLGRGAGSPF